MIKILKVTVAFILVICLMTHHAMAESPGEFQLAPKVESLPAVNEFGYMMRFEEYLSLLYQRVFEESQKVSLTKKYQKLKSILSFDPLENWKNVYFENKPYLKLSNYLIGSLLISTYIGLFFKIYYQQNILGDMKLWISTVSASFLLTAFVTFFAYANRVLHAKNYDILYESGYVGKSYIHSSSTIFLILILSVFGIIEGYVILFVFNNIMDFQMKNQIIHSIEAILFAVIFENVVHELGHLFSGAYYLRKDNKEGITRNSFKNRIKIIQIGPYAPFWVSLLIMSFLIASNLLLKYWIFSGLFLLISTGGLVSFFLRFPGDSDAAAIKSNNRTKKQYESFLANFFMNYREEDLQSISSFSIDEQEAYLSAIFKLDPRWVYLDYQFETERNNISFDGYYKSQKWQEFLRDDIRQGFLRAA